MSYSKQNFSDGDVLHASQLNHIEDGVAANEAAISAEEAARNAAIENQTVRYDVAQALSDEAKARARENIGAASLVGHIELKARKASTASVTETFTRIGNPLTVTDALEEAAGFAVRLEPVQAGSGDPSPTNIRPITGWDNVYIGQYGSKNLVAGYLQEGSIGTNGVVNGSAQFSVYYARVRKGQQYTLVSKEGQAVYGYLDSASVAIGSQFCSEYPNRFVESMTTTVDLIRYRTITALIDGWIAWRTTYGDTTGAIYEGSRLLDYEAPKTDIIPISLMQGGNTETVYGGTLTVNEDGSGELVVDKYCIDLGSLTWNYEDVTSRFYCDNLASYLKGKTIDGMARTVKCISDMYECLCNSEPYAQGWNSILYFSSELRIYVHDSRYTDATTFKSGVTGSYLVYELATPQTYTFTAEQLTTLLGYNRISCDAGQMTLTYHRDKYLPAAKVLAQLPKATVSGDVASFTDGADGLPMHKLSVAIDPVQAGSGDPSPENIRAITGYDAVEVVSTGKNLFDKNSVDPTHGYLVQPDGLISSSENYRVSDWIRVEPDEKYTVSNGTTRGQSPSVAWYDKNRNLLVINNHKSYGFPETYTAPAGAVWMRESVHVNDLDTFMLEHGETVSAYEPFGSILTLNLASAAGGTVYGGTVTVNEDGSGELVVDHRYWSANGSVSWTKGASDNSWSATEGYNNDATTTGTGWCNYFNYVASWSSTGTMFAASNRIFIASGNPWNTLEEVQAAFAANPLQVVYPLAVPLVYTFTTEQMTTLLGTNTVAADCGAVTVTYARDLATVIQALESAILSLGANV